MPLDYKNLNGATLPRLNTGSAWVAFLQCKQGFKNRKFAINIRLLLQGSCLIYFQLISYSFFTRSFFSQYRSFLNFFTIRVSKLSSDFLAKNF